MTFARSKRLMDLTSAIELNLAGTHEPALAAANAASAEMKRRKQRAGALRADVEGTYALYRLQRYADCAATGKAAERDARAAQYEWISARLLLEIGNCEAALGREGNGLTAGEQVWAASQRRFSFEISRG